MIQKEFICSSRLIKSRQFRKLLIEPYPFIPESGVKVRNQIKVKAFPPEEVAYLELGDTVLKLMTVKRPISLVKSK